LIDAIASPITFDGHRLVISGSFGCAVYPEHGGDGLTLLKRADDAMYRAKNVGGGRYALYGPLPRLDAHAGAAE
jgi:GGDEF domain-containing protein